ncbi:Imm21 family immunity protein [Streptomyces aureus]|uniref:Imm21 family immunity protein n=1 Tax=Streptomyces aureus TaxID=193461 RepID=UPI001FD728CA|nr:Imm21 family immunity protein [Streptomyces aureus]
MSDSVSAVTGVSPASPLSWVESEGGPLVVVPVSALAAWRGCTLSEVDIVYDDCDRACAVAGLAGVIAVGTHGAQALVLGDEPAVSCYLPEQRVFLRWLAASSDAAIKAGALGVLAAPDTPWEECGTWVVDGPAVLISAAEAGAALNIRDHWGRLPDQAPVPLPAGRWRVRAVHAQADRHTWVGLVQLLPDGGSAGGGPS